MGAPSSRSLPAMTVGELEAVVDGLAPFALAQEWDNVGLLLGRRDRTIAKVLVALELREAVLDEAADAGCEAVVVHHPPIFPSLTTVTDTPGPQRLILRAAETGVAIVAAHTNLDSAAGGLNDLMAADLGVATEAPLAPNAQMANVGLGRVGTRQAAPLGALVAHVMAVYGEAGVTHSGDLETVVSRVACCTGSGAGLIDLARDANVDVYVTCDLKYHDADRAGELPLIGLGHATVERRAMRQWTKTLAATLEKQGVGAVFAETDTDPWSPSR